MFDELAKLHPAVRLTVSAAVAVAVILLLRGLQRLITDKDDLLPGATMSDKPKCAKCNGHGWYLYTYPRYGGPDGNQRITCECQKVKEPITLSSAFGRAVHRLHSIDAAPNVTAEPDEVAKLTEENTKLKAVVSKLMPSPYCPMCGACGECGCCPPDRCKELACRYGDTQLKAYKDMEAELVAAEQELERAEKLLRRLIDNGYGGDRENEPWDLAVNETEAFLNEEKT